MLQEVDILIVGAGISGLMAAEKLKENSDKTVLLIDKSRSPGGRLATRRIEQGKFDHGAQFFTVRSNIFKEKVQKWVEQGWVFPWFSKEHPRYASVNGMNQLAKHLAHSHKVEYNLLAETVAVQENGDYVVTMRDLMNNTSRSIRAKSIIMTCPTPQVLQILQRSQYEIDQEDFQQLADVSYTNCLTLLLSMKDDFALQNEYLYEPVPGVIAWIADNRQKGISQESSVTVHLDPQWSITHFEKSDTEILKEIMPHLQVVFADRTEWDIPYQVKRWRYAQAYNLIKAPYLDVNPHHPFVICGDAFSSIKGDVASKIENAALSGIYTADYLSKEKCVL
ncbi:NAD(P)/FAD-dependent oxidoreductase [Lysinibacillus antri]|nr:FAD-dependent oxidoreductase [Lysinibacillus antri]